MISRAVVRLLLALGLAFAGPAKDDPQQRSIELPPDNAVAELKPGPGVETARRSCVPCHSTDYIVRQPPSDARRWEDEVKKMVTVFGAPVSDQEAKVIVEYLASSYGPQTGNRPASAPGKPVTPERKKKPRSSR